MSELRAALERLDEITRRLRVECPWDREQDERSIVPHTVEEAYELADAAHAGDDEKLVDELGDVLFQVYFLALLLEERGRGSLAEVADHVRAKLIRRHPHVFGDRSGAGRAGPLAHGGDRSGAGRAGPRAHGGDRSAETAADVVRNWDEIKREQEGGGEIFGPIPQTLPATLYAKKVLRRASSAGFEWNEDDSTGGRLLAAVRDAVAAGDDPELALRQAADRFRDEVERG